MSGSAFTGLGRGLSLHFPLAVGFAEADGPGALF
jgi:hypothetical protein